MQSFQDALKALQAALEHEHVPEITGADYTRTHDRFEAVSTQRDQIADHLAQHIKDLSRQLGRPVRALSVGCGDGTLDLKIISQVKGCLASFHGLDSNLDQIHAFKDKAGDNDLITLVHGERVSALGPATFDVVYAIHVIYYVADELEFIRGLASVTGSPGLIVLAVAPKSPMNALADLFWKAQGTHALFANGFASLLEQNGYEFVRATLNASIPLKYYIGDEADQDVIDFTVQAECASLSPAAADLLAQAFEAASRGGDPAPYLEHPVDMFVLPR